MNEIIEEITETKNREGLIMQRSKTNILKSLVGSVVIWTLSLAAYAAMPEGVYDDGKTAVYAQSVLKDNVPTTFALLVANYGAGLFRVEPVDQNRTAWVPIYQSSKYLLTLNVDQEATYLGTLEEVKGKPTLRLQATDLGKKQVCNGEAALELRENNKKRKWLSEAQQNLQIEDGKNGRWDVNSIKASLQFSQNTFSGSFLASMFIPGVYFLRSTEYDSEAESGLSFGRQIIAVATQIQEESWGWKTRAIFIRMSPDLDGKQNCMTHAFVKLNTKK